MTGDNGGGKTGDADRLAPVIPLFGGVGERRAVPPAVTNGEQRGVEPHRANRTPDAMGPARGETGDAAAWRSTWDAASDADAGEPSERHPARGAARRSERSPNLRAVRPMTTDDGAEADLPDPEQAQEAAAEALVRKLRSRSLSISESRAVLRGHALRQSQIDDVIDDFCRRGYLDDAILAGHLVTSGAERKGQGRVALSRALAQRGIARDVIEAALAELPDDDADRALDYARTKARSLARLDFETALRRLVGQLARRGYNGSVAMTAARTALTEESRPAPTHGVRFVDSD
jgi:regulatory protein